MENVELANGERSFKIRALKTKRELEAAAALVGKTRAEETSGGYDEKSATDYFMKRFSIIKGKEKRSKVYGLFHRKTNELVGAAAIGPLAVLEKKNKKKYEAFVSKHLKRHVKPEKIGLLTGMGITPEHRRKGGAEMLTKMREKFGEKNFEHMVGNVMNPDWKQRYINAGYAKIGKISIGGREMDIFHKHTAKGMPEEFDLDSEIGRKIMHHIDEFERKHRNSTGEELKEDAVALREKVFMKIFRHLDLHENYDPRSLQRMDSAGKNKTPETLAKIEEHYKNDPHFYDRLDKFKSALEAVGRHVADKFKKDSPAQHEIQEQLAHRNVRIYSLIYELMKRHGAEVSKK